ncbi:MAG: magnesium/cobalt transporter CorA [Candidatus Omnitrophota bacterium]
MIKKIISMPKIFSSTKDIGLPPGTICVPVKPPQEKVRITVFDYTESYVTENELKDIEECFCLRDKASITWINIDGVHDCDLIQKIDAHFNIHPLILEDIVAVNQRPKFDDFEQYMFIAMKMIYWGKETNAVESEQVSLIIGPNYVISFQEKPGDVFEGIRERLRTGKGRVRKMGADYLGYCLLDAVVDNYFLVLEKFDDQVEELDEQIKTEANGGVSRDLHVLKRNLIFLKKQVWPLRELLAAVLRSESRLVKKSTHIYFRDLYDHTVQVVDTIETFREMMAGMNDVYLSMISHRMNEVMKVLTMFASIFIPLTFIAGVYGMNFSYMPELNWKWGYFLALGIMAFVAAGMLVYFKRKKWF